MIIRSLILVIAFSMTGCIKIIRTDVDASDHFYITGNTACIALK